MISGGPARNSQAEDLIRLRAAETCSPLFISVCYHNLEALRLLLKAGINVDEFFRTDIHPSRAVS